MSSSEHGPLTGEDTISIEGHLDPNGMSKVITITTITGLDNFTIGMWVTMECEPVGIRWFIYRLLYLSYVFRFEAQMFLNITVKKYKIVNINSMSSFDVC